MENEFQYQEALALAQKLKKLQKQGLSEEEARRLTTLEKLEAQGVLSKQPEKLEELKKLKNNI